MCAKLGKARVVAQLRANAQSTPSIKMRAALGHQKMLTRVVLDLNYRAQSKTAKVQTQALSLPTHC